MKPEVVKALDLIFLLHADHEQNCSTSTVRMVASSQANLFASARRGLRALGTAARRRQPGRARNAAANPQGRATTARNSSPRPRTRTAAKLMGFGHRVTKITIRAPRSSSEACDDVLSKLHISDPLLDIAKKLEEAALKDPISSSASFIQTWIFTAASSCAPSAFRWRCSPVIFAIGRMPGWIANYKEIMDEPSGLERLAGRGPYSANVSAGRTGAD
jgi:citrate synthase